MELKNKIPAPVGDVQKVARALLSWLNEVDPAAPYWLSPAVSAEPPPEPDLHVSAYPAPSAITITVLGQV